MSENPNIRKASLDALGDDEILRDLILRMVRRRAAGFTPVVIVALNEDDAKMVIDTNLEPDEREAFLTALPTTETARLHEPQDH